jgi:hypothetical protein
VLKHPTLRVIVGVSGIMITIGVVSLFTMLGFYVGHPAEFAITINKEIAEICGAVANCNTYIYGIWFIAANFLIVGGVMVFAFNLRGALRSNGN